MNTITVLHVVDMSHVHLFVNFWIVEKEFNVFPKEWKYQVACLAGEDGTAIDRVISSIHGPGCSQIIPGNMHRNKIYLAKMMAIVAAFRALPRQNSQGLLVIDIDSVLIRNPVQLLFGHTSHINHEFDIISSRDHGPSQLEFSETWGGARFCTGFIYFKYSPHMCDLLQYVLARVSVYGHDQIQFNAVLTRGGLIWYDETVHSMADAVTEKVGYLPWRNQVLSCVSCVSFVSCVSCVSCTVCLSFPSMPVTL